jgi:Ser/Thr protein kinase RdoA (MazF antagonist)
MSAADSALERLRVNWQVYWPKADLDEMAADLHDRFAAAVRAWNLDDVRPLPGGMVALVCGVSRNGRPAVLKVSPRGHPDAGQLAAEGDALSFWQPTGAVPRLYDRSSDRLTILMERAQPGLPLEDSNLDWGQRLALLGELAGRLHAAGRPPRGFVNAREYTSYWRPVFAVRPELPAELDELTVPRDSDVLIHADLHAGNALRSGEAWKVIDPHAVRAERHADIWALLDPLALVLPDEPKAAVRAARERVRTYADAAGLDSARAGAWARLRALGEALFIDARAGASAADRAWAARLHRMAEALR